jgi:hypothetical protein
MKTFSWALIVWALNPTYSQLPAQATNGQSISITDLGAHPDGSSAIETTAAFRTAFGARSSGLIRIPPGRYLVDNSSGPLTASNFSGELRFEGNAVLVFTNSSKAGMLFDGGTGARIYGFKGDYVSPPVSRNSPQEELKLSGTVDTVLTDTLVKNSPAAGILFYDCIRPKVTNAVVLDSFADGLHFANCQDAEVTNLTTVNTGDDGLAFLNYSAYPDKTGGLAHNIHVLNSRARGITVIGQSNVTISNFTIRNTSVSGVLCAEDTNFKTRVPSNVRFSNGLIENAGALTPLSGNKYGIEFNGQISCSFSDIDVLNAAGSGVSGTAPEGSVRLSNISVKGSRSGLGFNFYKTAAVEISNSAAANIPSYGFMFNRCGRVQAEGLTATATAQTDPLQRSIWFENGKTVLASNLTIAEGPNPAGGHIIGAYQESGLMQSGTVHGIISTFRNGPVVIQNNCPHLEFTR